MLIRTSNTRATVSLVALCFVAVLGIVLASYLAVCSRAMNLSNRSFQAVLGNQLAELGLEEGLRAFNGNYLTGANTSAPLADWTSGGMTADWTLDTANKRATCTITFPSSKFGQGITAAVKIRVDNYDVAQLGAMWTNTATYLPDNVVGHTDGKWYRAITTHFNKQPGGTNSMIYWIPEQGPVSDDLTWQVGRTYRTGQLVISSGVLYRCTYSSFPSHVATSNNAPGNTTYWTMVPFLSQGADPHTGNESIILTTGLVWRRYFGGSPLPLSYNAARFIWDSSVTYYQGDLVFESNGSYYSWYRYRNNTPSSGHTVDETSYWQTAHSLANSASSPWNWSTNYSYFPGDAVYYASRWYRCIVANSGQTPSVSSPYWSTSPRYLIDWDSGRQYSQNDVVRYNGIWYLSRANGNIGQNPATTNSWVGADTTDTNYIWNSTTTYAANAYRCYGGVWYVSLAANSGKAPNDSSAWTPSWTNSWGVKSGAPVIYAESTITIAGNPPVTTQLRANIAPAPLFPNAVGASSMLSINSGTFDSYDSNADVYNGTNNGSANVGTSAVIAAGTSLTITGNPSIKGYLAAPTLPANINSTMTLNGNPFSTDKSRASRSANIPQFAIRNVAGATTLTNLSTIGTPGAKTPSVYSYPGDLDLTGTLTIAGPVILDIQGKLQIRTGGQIVIAATGSAEIHATRIRIGGNGVDNKTLDPLRCVILCTGTTSTHTFTTSQKFHGVIYLPNEDLDFSGTSMEIFGAVSARSITFSNSPTFHYDTSLRYSSIPGVDQPYTAVQWRELPSSERATMQ